MTTISIDPGAGTIKILSPTGRAAQPSIIATDGSATISALAGLATGDPPARIETAHGAFVVGLQAHQWGRPVENLDPDRFSGAPEVAALVYAALTRAGWTAGRASVIVGLPLDLLTGIQAEANAAAVKSWLLGNHTWCMENETIYSLTITGVKIAAQPVGALMDWLLDDAGHYLPDRRAQAKGELGIISLGMNTVELLAVDNLRIMQRFTAGRASGVRRLLELCNPGELYSRGEMDARLRAGTLDTAAALPIWASEVSDTINKRWGDAWKRFATVIVTGGGAHLLYPQLQRKFQGRTWIAPDPVLSTAQGLYKYAQRKG